MNRRNRRGPGAWYRVHRVLGLVSAFFVLLLALTGIALNHTELLGLDERRADAGWLLDWYGVEGPPEMVGYQVDGRWLTRMGDRLWLGAKPVLEPVRSYQGAVAGGRFLVAALGDEVALLTAEGRLVERMGPAAGVPAGIERIGTRPDGGVVLDAASGAYRADATLSAWRRAPRPGNAAWAVAARPPDATREALAAAWRGRGLSLERVLLDLHSGRLLGRFGVWLMDAMALAFVLLAATGLWIWTRRRNGRRNGGPGGGRARDPKPN